VILAVSAAGRERAVVGGVESWSRPADLAAHVSLPAGWPAC